jgi:hypothetical protein
MALTLSQWSSWRSCPNQQASATPLVTTRYSASTLDQGDDVLVLGGPGDKVVVEEHSVA